MDSIQRLVFFYALPLMFMKPDIGLPLGMHFVVFRKLAHWEPPVTSPVMWDVAGYSAAQALSP